MLLHPQQASSRPCIRSLPSLGPQSPSQSCPYPSSSPTRSAPSADLNLTLDRQQSIPQAVENWKPRSFFHGITPEVNDAVLLSSTSLHLTSPHLTSPHLTSPHLTSPHLPSPPLPSPPLPSLPLPSPPLLPGRTVPAGCCMAFQGRGCSTLLTGPRVSPHMPLPSVLSW